MGVETLTPKLPHQLITEYNALVVFGFAKRLPNAEGFEVYFFQPEDDIYSEDLETSAAAMNRTIEKMVAIAQRNINGHINVSVAALIMSPTLTMCLSAPKTRGN